MVLINIIYIPGIGYNRTISRLDKGGAYAKKHSI